VRCSEKPDGQQERNRRYAEKRKRIMKKKSPGSYVRKAQTILKKEGFLSLIIISLQKVQQFQRRKTKIKVRKLKRISLVGFAEVMKADWEAKPYTAPSRKRKAPYTINWVMSPPGGGGGHQNIFRFIEYLTKKGHKNNVYLYSEVDDMTVDQARKNVSAYCPVDNIGFYRLKADMVESDIIFATGWETAYPVFNRKSSARKMYFVQDFEPYFYAMGTDYVLAENTYKFGFHGITAGGWLAKKLKNDYGMDCDFYEFGAEKTLYGHLNHETRKEIFFYARPVTERRGFDLGIMALQIFHEENPEYVINLAGWDVSDYDIPFPYINHGAMKLEELPALYNRCAAALVISLTNMSLLPLELLACGTIPVVTDGLNNREVSENPYIVYAPSSPQSLARALAMSVTKKKLPEYAQQASESVGELDWERAGELVESVLRKELHG
jgi:glycosyltransferase involved in cell wall biosynthesis